MNAAQQRLARIRQKFMQPTPTELYFREVELDLALGGTETANTGLVIISEWRPA